MSAETNQQCFYILHLRSNRKNLPITFVRNHRVFLTNRYLTGLLLQIMLTEYIL